MKIVVRHCHALFSAAACLREANTETGFFHSSAVLLTPWALGSSFSPSSFSRSMSPKLFLGPLAAAANGLAVLLNALNALVFVLVLGVGVDGTAAGFPKGDGLEPKLDFPKYDPRGEGAPNAGVDELSLSSGVFAALKEVCPKNALG